MILEEGAEFVCRGYSAWNGSAFIIITNGATASIQAMYCAQAAANDVTVCVSGENSVLSASSAVSIGGSPVLAGGKALLRVRDGARMRNTVNRPMYVWPQGTVALDRGSVEITGADPGKKLYLRGGLLEGMGVVTGHVYNAYGFVHPGGSNVVGRLDVSGHFENGYSGTYEDSDGATETVTGTLQLDIAGRESHDLLAVDGHLVCKGTLRVSLLEGFKPDQHGARFKLLDWTTIEGEFDTIELPGPADYWNLDDLYVTGEIEYAPPRGTLLMMR